MLFPPEAALGDLCDVAVGIVLIGVGCVVPGAGDGQACHLSGGLGAGLALTEGVRPGQNRAAAFLRLLAVDATEAVIGIGYGDIVGGCRRKLLYEFQFAALGW